MNHPIMIKEMEKETVRRILIDRYQQYKEVFNPQRWTGYLKEIISSIDTPQIRA